MNRAPFHLLGEPELDGALLVFEGELAARAASFRPRSGQLVEMRGVILAAFDAAPHSTALARPRVRAPLPWRLGAATLALLLLAGSGQFASRAGEPGQALYPARLAAEDLWSATTVGQGWQGQFDRLDLRLRDAEAMAARGDAAGVDAALAAYASALADLSAAARKPGADTTGLAGRLDAHRGALAAVGAAMSGPAAALARREGQDVQRILGQLRFGSGGPGVVPGGLRRDGRAEGDRPAWQGSPVAGQSSSAWGGGSAASSTAASSSGWRRTAQWGSATRTAYRHDRDRRYRWRR
jgi:hypothetical protein